MKLLAIRRLFHIQRVVIRYRLDDLVFAQRATRLHGASASASANERIERN